MARKILALFLLCATLLLCGCYGDQTADNNACSLEYIVKDQDPQLKTLYDYTVFHIGVYITLTTGILAALNYKAKSGYDLVYIVPLLSFASAGACGGIVGSNICNYVTYNAEKVVFETAALPKQTQEVIPFLKGKYKVFGYETTYAKWIKLEHQCFWFAAATLILAVVIYTNLVYFGAIKEPKKITLSVNQLTNG